MRICVDFAAPVQVGDDIERLACVFLCCVKNHKSYCVNVIMFMKVLL